MIEIFLLNIIAFGLTGGIIACNISGLIFGLIVGLIVAIIVALIFIAILCFDKGINKDESKSF